MIRHAKETDLFELVDMARAMHADSDFKDIPFDYADTAKYLNDAILASNYGVIVAEKDGEIIGASISVIVPFAMFTVKVTQGSDIALYVKPERRGGSAAARLVKAKEEWERSQGAARSYVGNSTGDKNIDEMYRKMGYTTVGGVHRKDLTDINERKG